MEYEHILTSEKWVIFIDPSILSENWFMRNKSKYGNSKWLMKHITLPTMILWTILWTPGPIMVYYAYENDSPQLGAITSFICYLLMVFWLIIHMIIGKYI